VVTVWLLGALPSDVFVVVLRTFDFLFRQFGAARTIIPLTKICETASVV
jgi:hypothetical protein